MIYDTKTEELAAPSVYDVAAKPRTDKTLRFESYNATYVGG